MVISSTASAGNNRPFWTEKSSYLEGKRLFAVGIASNVATIEEGRKIAFQNGKQEISNFLQITDLEELIIETQMTFEEINPDKSYTVFRLLKVESQEITKLKENKLKATKAVYQDQQEKEIQTKREPLTKIQETKQSEKELQQQKPKQKGLDKRGWLGVEIQSLTYELAEYHHVESKDGVFVIEVFKGDPADRAGIKPHDIIIEVNGGGNKKSS